MKTKQGSIIILGVGYPKMVAEGTNLPDLVRDIASKSGFGLKNGDIVILSHTAVAKSLGLKTRLAKLRPSAFAMSLAERTGQEPGLIELVLRESKELVRVEDHHIICRSKAGIISAHAGIDVSNVDGGRSAVSVPEDPDEVARRFRACFKKLGLDVAVIITDTLGRPFRMGEVNFAIGSAGIAPLLDLRGKKDLVGRTLRVKRIAIADELAAASELVTGSSSEGVVGAIIRGYHFKHSRKGARSLQRPPSRDLFA